MTIDTLRSLIRTEPFRPFEIHTGPGQSYLVIEPDQIALAPDGDLVVVLSGPHGVKIVEVESIVEITTMPARTSL